MLVGTDAGKPVEMSIAEALKMADENETDLVQMSEKDGVAVCKLMNYSKFIYEQHKKEKANAKAKQELKEVRISDGIADNDLKTKAKTASRIMDDGDKVKVVITYKGRSVAFIDRGIAKLEEFEKMIEKNHTVDKQPKIEGNRVYMILSPRK